MKSIRVNQKKKIAGARVAAIAANHLDTRLSRKYSRTPSSCGNANMLASNKNLQTVISDCIELNLSASGKRRISLGDNIKVMELMANDNKAQGED